MFTKSAFGRLSVSTDIYVLQLHIITKYNEQSQLNMRIRRINMLSFLKRIFGVKPADPTVAPYKVESVAQFPFPTTVKEKSDKKPATKKPIVPKKPRAKKSKE